MEKTGHLCFAALRNCYATLWSHGEICVGCNCCGRIDRSKRDGARLNYWEERLKDNETFDRWIPEHEETQRKNVKENIRYCRRRIAYYRRKIGSKR